MALKLTMKLEDAIATEPNCEPQVELEKSLTIAPASPLPLTLGVVVGLPLSTSIAQFVTAEGGTLSN